MWAWMAGMSGKERVFGWMCGRQSPRDPNGLHPGGCHQQNACHFKMPIWPVDRHGMPVDRVNMAEIPVNRTPPCIQAQTIPIQDTVLSTGHIVLLTGRHSCSHGLPEPLLVNMMSLPVYSTCTCRVYRAPPVNRYNWHVHRTMPVYRH